MSLKKPISFINTGQDLLALIERGDKNAFTDFYSVNFKKLILVSDKYVKNVYTAEEIVQNVFLKIWENKDLLEDIKSITGYLYRSVVNSSINHVNRERNIEKHHHKIAEYFTADDIEMLDEQNELIVLLFEEIEHLPEKCRKIFKLSRLEGIKYKDIAIQLGISEKTVENHMGNALKILRAQVLMRTHAQNADGKTKYFSLLSLFLY